MNKTDSRPPQVINRGPQATINTSAKKLLACQFLAIIQDKNQQLWLRPLEMGPLVLDVVGINFYGMNKGPARFASKKLPKGEFLLEWDDQQGMAKLIPVIHKEKK